MRKEIPNSVKIIVLADNLPGKDNPKLIPSNSLSIYLEANITKKTKILFDTGCSYELLKINAEILGVDLADLDYIFVSLWRKCHIGGLVTGLRKILRSDTKIVLPPIYKERINQKLIEKGFVIATDFSHDYIEILGPFGSLIKEYSLNIQLKNGNLILVGCATYGLEKLFVTIKNKNLYPIKALVGGLCLSYLDALTFNDLRKAIDELGIERIYPLHSTAYKARIEILKNIFDIDTVCGVGFAATIC